jgi:hypothetical protein
MGVGHQQVNQWTDKRQSFIAATCASEIGDPKQPGRGRDERRQQGPCHWSAATNRSGFVDFSTFSMSELLVL